MAVDELAVWRQPWNEIKEPYRTKYCEAFPPSSPEEDFEDRGTLYAIRVNILDSILYKDDKSYRDMCVPYPCITSIWPSNKA